MKSPPRALNLGWTAPPFEIPADIRAAWDMRDKGARAEQEWRTRFAAYKAEFPALAAELERRMSGDLPSGFADLVNAYVGRTQAEGKALATRQSSQAALNALGPSLPELFGGSADLTPSNGTLRKDSVALTPDSPGGNYVHFGVREFGMSAILNGIVCHGGFIPYGGTFLTFSDYARNAVRMAALMRLRRDLRLYARFHRTRRRRPDAPADRARREPARHSAHGCVAALRCGRDRGRLGRGDRERREVRRA